METEPRYLLDTSTLLWAALTPEKLSRTARTALQRESALVHVSVASVWEMQIKHALGKLPLPEDANRMARRYLTSVDAETLDIAFDHIGRLYELPPVHRDPFDRILIAQAIAERLTIISPDAAFRAYPVNVLW